MLSAPAQHHSGGCGAAPRQRRRGASRVQQARLRVGPARYAAQNGVCVRARMRAFVSFQRLVSLLRNDLTKCVSSVRCCLVKKLDPKGEMVVSPFAHLYLRLDSVPDHCIVELNALGLEAGRFTPSQAAKDFQVCAVWSAQDCFTAFESRRTLRLMCLYARPVPTIVFLCHAQSMPRSSFSRLNRWSLDS
jgi:hypothetical protein